MNAPVKTPNPVGLLAELTHRCPLGCPYCSNPLELESRATEIDTETWKRVFSEAAALGVLHAHLSGGEPAARRDLARDRRPLRLGRPLHQSDHLRDRPDAGAREGAGRRRPRSCAALDPGFARRPPPTASPAIRAPSQRKQAVAAWVIEAGLPLTVNAVIHRANIARAGEMVKLAVALGAQARRDRAYAILRLGHHQSRRPDADRGAGRRRRSPRSRRCARLTPASSSSTTSSPTITRAIPRPAWAAGPSAPSTSRRRARCLPCHAAETHSGPRILERARSLAGGHLVPFAGASTPFAARRG